MNKYIIEYSNPHWCGGDAYVVVNANSEEEAIDKAAYHMDETQWDLFSDEYSEDSYYEDECAYVVDSVKVLDSNNEHWPYYTKPGQKYFYPEIK